MEKLNKILINFKIPKLEYKFSVISNGFINDTYLVKENEKPKYILQRINTNVFKNVYSIFKNLEATLPLLDDINYKKIELVKSKTGNSYYQTGSEHIWRLMTYIQDSTVFNTTDNPVVAYEAGRVIGIFHKLLLPCDTESIKDIITDFHNIFLRYDQFKVALKNADNEKIEIAEKAILFVEKNITLVKKIDASVLPVRICHNDTKLNNILFSKKNKALCLIDLDTIMKGTFLYDFGDAVRTIVNSAPEDEKNLSKINFSKNLFISFVKGLSEQADFLSEKEKELLPIGAVLMPFLHGIRALTDYLENNKYYKVKYENQNLDRSLSLFKFAELGIKNLDFMTNVIRQYLN